MATPSMTGNWSGLDAQHFVNALKRRRMFIVRGDYTLAVVIIPAWTYDVNTALRLFPLYTFFR